MPQITLQQAFDSAFRLHQSGRTAEAESLYRQILAHEPGHVDAMQMLGVLVAQAGRGEEGLGLIRAAIALNPAAASCHTNLGMVLAGRGELEAAIESFRRAIELRPESPEAHNNLANALGAVGRIDESIQSYRRAVALRPNFAQAYNNLGTALCVRGDAEEGIAALRRAVALKPDYAQAFFNLGKALNEHGDAEGALTALGRAVELQPAYPDAFIQVGIVHQTQGRLNPAVEAYERALAVRPEDPEALNNLATAYQEMREYDKAIDTYRRAITARPDHPEANGNLANSLSQIGEIDAALATYRRSVELTPNARTASGMMLFVHLHPDFGPEDILREHRRWADTYARPLAPARIEHANDRDPNRRIRIGYVSPDFTNHPVGRFMLPVLANHDRAAFEVFCYSDTRATDGTTDQLRAHADVWRDTANLTDRQLAERVREDRIDVLVDLLMHAKGCRLLAFARKPAPVQISYLSYCSTTGLPAMDYRISDPYLDPPGTDESVYTEKTLRLPSTYWCFNPFPEIPDVGPLPATANGYVTLGCMNNFWKVTPPTRSLWFEVLRRLPDARLLLHAHEGSHRQRFRERMADAGLEPGRVEFVGFHPLAGYYAQHARIDLALDPFPYGGGTTTCESLWSGAPVVSLAGRTAVSRAGLSILSNVGLPELVARTTDQYLDIATALARDLPRLAELRAGLRGRMCASPLMDGPRFARDIESLYRRAWRAWCESGAVSA